MGRILALDIGSKNIGVAVTDEEQIIAQPLGQTVSPRQIVDFLTNFIQESPLEEIVIGLPRTMSNELGAQAESVRNLGREIEKSIPVKVSYFDERLTTKEAEHFMSSDIPKDCLAAQKLLEQYLQKIKN